MTKRIVFKIISIMAIFFWVATAVLVFICFGINSLRVAEIYKYADWIPFCFIGALLSTGVSIFKY